MNEYVVAAFNAELILGLDIQATSSGVSVTARLAGILADQAVGDKIDASGMDLRVATNILAEGLQRLVQEAEGAANYNLSRLTPLLETVA